MPDARQSRGALLQQAVEASMPVGSLRLPHMGTVGLPAWPWQCFCSMASVPHTTVSALEPCAMAAVHTSYCLALRWQTHRF